VHATKLDDRSIAAWNAVVAGADLPEAMAQERRARFGIPDGTRVSAVLLNDLDDWDSFHRALTHSISSGT
jgi:selenocysteine lyase/cysteine desulfurase